MVKIVIWHKTHTSYQELSVIFAKMSSYKTDKGLLRWEFLSKIRNSDLFLKNLLTIKYIKTKSKYIIFLHVTYCIYWYFSYEVLSNLYDSTTVDITPVIGFLFL